MRLHDRYLFREFLTPLAYCLGGLMIFVIASDAFGHLGELQERKLHGFEIVAYLALDMPGFLVQVLPIALLLALLYALTHHARHNEITALRAAGISLWRLCAPYFIVGLVASAVMFWLDEIVVPLCDEHAALILSRHVQKDDDLDAQKTQSGISFYNSAAHRFWYIGGYHPVPPEMRSITVSWMTTDGSWRILHAQTASYTNDNWLFSTVNIHRQAGRAAPLVPYLVTNQSVVPEFTETPRQIWSEIKISPMLNVGAHLQEIPLRDLYDYLRLHPNLRDGRDLKGARLLTKFHERLAAPFTCLVVVLMAIPFGAPSGRRNLFFGVAGSIFICFGFYVIQSVSLALGMGGHLPGWLAAWLPNFIFGGLGFWLITRVR